MMNTSNDVVILTPALRTAGNIVTIIDLDVLEPLARIIHWSIKGTVLDMKKFFLFYYFTILKAYV